MNRSKCKIFDLEYLSGASVCLDWMHSKYLGMDQYLLGSVFFLLVFHIMANTPKQNLERCWMYIKKFYKDHKVKHQYRAISKLSMFTRKTGYAKLRGKAGEIKGLIRPMLGLFEKFMDRNNEMHKKIKLILDLHVKIECLIDTYRKHLSMPKPAADNFVKYILGVAQLQNQVAAHFWGQGIKIFSVTAKTHSCVHAALLAHTLNPAMVWCFSGEDMMRKIQKLAESCVRGNSWHGTTIKMVAHYRLAMHLQFLQHRK